MKNTYPTIAVKNLSVSFNHKQVIHDISFNIPKNKIVGVVGESGSGKSVTSLAMMGLLPDKIATITGSIKYNGHEISELDSKKWQHLRGNEISMVFQEPMSALNPSMKCGKQVLEIITKHQKCSKKEAKEKVLELFDKVKLPNIERIFNAYPHELSGGQKQRIVIAMAIANQPKLLIADEPTTALDVTVQKEIILLIKELQKDYGMSVLFISHDLGLVQEIANETIVMYQGKIMEHQITEDLFKNPQSNYTKALIYARPSTKERLHRLPTIQDFMEGKLKSEIITEETRIRKHQELYSQAPLLEVENISKTFFTKTGLFTKTGFKAVNQVSFKIYEGETLGLVGESGCGKSTLGNIILNLTKIDSGSVKFKGTSITQLSKNQLKALRKEIQIIFQDPFASLNPNLKIGEAILEPMTAHKLYKNYKERKEHVLELLEKVGLQKEHFDRYPHEFSGGQRQRIGIARTIALQPKLIICDESVSALDISVQAQVLNLLNELKEKFGFTYLFISHDLSVVKYMSDQLLVMNKGVIEEQGEADKIYSSPVKEYTKNLIDAIPGGL